MTKRRRNGSSDAFNARTWTPISRCWRSGETPITGRPGDFLKPEVEKAKEDIGDLAKNDEDLLIFALYPTTGREFLQKKYNES